MQEVKVDLARAKFFDEFSDSRDTHGPSPELELVLTLSKLQRGLKKGGIPAVNHFAGRQFINSIHGSSSHELIRQDLLDPVMILSETIGGCGFRVKEWCDDKTEFYLIAEKI